MGRDRAVEGQVLFSRAFAEMHRIEAFRSLKIHSINAALQPIGALRLIKVQMTITLMQFPARGVATGGLSVTGVSRAFVRGLGVTLVVTPGRRLGNVASHDKYQSSDW